MTVEADWGDVLRRARRRDRRRTWILAAAAFATIAGAASALALTRPSIDFLSAPKSPRTVVDDFGRADVAAPPGMATGVLPHQTRRITSVPFRGRQIVLYVAPTKGGGFCELWAIGKGGGGGCDRTRSDIGQRLSLGRLGLDHGSFLTGKLGEAKAARIVVSFPDGSSDEVPFVWVGAPIDAGFFLYSLTGAQRTAASETVTVLDASGHVLTHATDPLRSPGPLSQGHHVAGIGYVDVPGRAIYAKRRLLFDLRSPSGRRTMLWTAPERGGGSCWWTNRGSGCDDGKEHFLPEFVKEHPQRVQLLRQLNLGLYGGNPVILCCTVGPKVARVEFRFQDGDRMDYAPRDGYLVVAIPPAHDALGHRLIKELAYNASGHVLAERSVRAKLPGVYPCAKRKHYAYGVTMCP